jgi:hypothetical protein
MPWNERVANIKEMSTASQVGPFPTHRKKSMPDGVVGSSPCSTTN